MKWAGQGGKKGKRPSHGLGGLKDLLYDWGNVLLAVSPTNVRAEVDMGGERCGAEDNFVTGHRAMSHKKQGEPSNRKGEECDWGGKKPKETKNHNDKGEGANELSLECLEASKQGRNPRGEGKRGVGLATN